MSNAMRRRTIGVLVALAFAMAGGAAAEASCAQGDATGTWRIHVYNDQDFVRCKIVIGNTGTIVAASSSCREKANTASSASGSIKLVSAAGCTFNGTITTAGDTNTLVEIAVARDKTTLSGVGFVGAEQFIFIGIKQ